MDYARYDQLARWYARVSWFGIFLNSLFIFPLLIAPVQFLALLNLKCDPPIFAQLCGMLLLWISIFYIPAIMDLKKYRVYAWIAICPSRAGGATFCISAVVIFGHPLGFLPIGLVDLFILSWQLAILMKIREVENPDAANVEAANVRAWKKKRLRTVLGVVAVLVLIVGVTAWYKLLREEPQQLGSMEERYKYGSIGAENAAGIPYWIWVVLPRIFPEYLPGPGGYNSLGLYNEPGQAMPVGFSTKTIGFQRVAINCAICHSATLRLSADEQPILLPGGGSNTFDALSYQHFLFNSAADPRFNSTRILAEIDKMYSLSYLDRFLYRFFLIPAAKKALLKEKETWTWSDVRPPWGRGRIDPFNPVKVSFLHVGIGDTIGNSDMMPIWNLRAHDKMALHWDGLNTDLTEVIRSSALGDGTAPKDMSSELLQQLQALQDWLMDLKPPPYPAARFPVNPALASAGAAVFARECASCHAFGGARTGQVIPLDEIGTDPHRLAIWPKEAADAYNAYGNGYSWKFSHFRSTNGYVAPPLDGIWTRGPYLHNGSVPTLRDLLEPPASRPKVFYRGYNVFDPKNVGFVAQGAEAQRNGFRYDTTVAGNSNQGHVWGTTLAAQDKEALIEFVKQQ